MGDDDSRMFHEMAIPDSAGLSEKQVTVSVISLTINHPLGLHKSCSSQVFHGVLQSGRGSLLLYFSAGRAQT